ncbi:MAG: hypothetical protein Q9185_000381 [Variospora sp. 1 TL-2023]
MALRRDLTSKRILPFCRRSVSKLHNDGGTVAARFPHDTISIPAARTRKHRFVAAKAVNPKFTSSIESSTAETALYLKAMRGQDEETKTRYVHISFREERVPFNEGQKKSNRRSLPKI